MRLVGFYGVQPRAFACLTVEGQFQAILTVALWSLFPGCLPGPVLRYARPVPIRRLSLPPPCCRLSSETPCPVAPVSAFATRCAIFTGATRPCCARTRAVCSAILARGVWDGQGRTAPLRGRSRGTGHSGHGIETRDRQVGHEPDAIAAAPHAAPFASVFISVSTLFSSRVNIDLTASGSE